MEPELTPAARTQVPGILVGGGELLVHVTGGLKVPEAVIGAVLDPLQAYRFGWKQNRVMQAGKPSRCAGSLQEPGADRRRRTRPAGRPAAAGHRWEARTAW
jgi:hypothetical protein